MTDRPPRISRARFLAARLLRDETALQALSAPQSELFAELDGRAVALVGNARALADTYSGPAIDSADLVIRVNRAPMPAAASHGTRTDWLALAVRLPAADHARLRPRRILWMSHKRKRLSWHIATGPGFALHPLDDWRRLGRTLGAPPSTGAMMIDLLARSPAAAVRLFGFDFFSSLSLTGSRTAARVPHDFAAERAFVEALLDRDPRFALHDMV